MSVKVERLWPFTDRKPQGVHIKISCGKLYWTNMHMVSLCTTSKCKQFHWFFRLADIVMCMQCLLLGMKLIFCQNKILSLCRQIGLLLCKADSKVTIIAEISMFSGNVSPYKLVDCYCVVSITQIMMEIAHDTPMRPLIIQHCSRYEQIKNSFFGI